jgi:CRP/FNR family transcriptional regulator, cyclic AMP receptor protein
MTYDPNNNALMQLLEAGTRHTLPKGQVLQVTDRNLVFLVKSGYIKRYQITNSGTQSIQSVYGPGQIFPLTPVYKLLYDVDINHGAEIFYYEAMVPSIVHSVGQSELALAVEKNNMLYKDILYVSSVRLRSNIQRLDNIALVNAHRRVAHQLAYFGDVFGEIKGDTIVIKLPLTHQELAAVLNMARETVSHVLGRLRDKEIINAEHKNIIILDLEKLKREAR